MMSHKTNRTWTRIPQVGFLWNPAAFLYSSRAECRKVLAKISKFRNQLRQARKVSQAGVNVTDGVPVARACWALVWVTESVTELASRRAWAVTVNTRDIPRLGETCTLCSDSATKSNLQKHWHIVIERCTGQIVRGADPFFLPLSTLSQFGRAAARCAGRGQPRNAHYVFEFNLNWSFGFAKASKWPRANQ